MVAGVVALVAAAQDGKGRDHGALARAQDRADQPELSHLPGWVGEQRCEEGEYGYNSIRRGEQAGPFSESGVRPAYPILILFLNFA